MSDLLWELRTYSFYPGKRDPYLQLWIDDVLPMYDAIGVRIVGCWLPDDDPLQYLWLRVYDDAAERAARGAVMRDRPEWARIAPNIPKMETKNETRDLVEGSFSTIGEAIRNPVGSGTEPYGVYQYRLVHLVPGTREAFMRGFEKDFMAIAREIGLTVLGPWLPLDDENAVLSIWAFRDETDRESTMGRLRGYPGLEGKIGALRTMEQSIDTRILRPTSFSPLGRYLRAS